MSNPLTPTFFSELTRFTLILSLSLGIIVAVNYYQITFDDIKQEAAVLLFGK